MGRKWEIEVASNAKLNPGVILRLNLFQLSVELLKVHTVVLQEGRDVPQREACQSCEKCIRCVKRERVSIVIQD